MNLSKKVVATGIAALALFGSAGVSFADAPGTGSGADSFPDLVIGGGSDTTYAVMQKLEVLYNGAPGCGMDTGGTSATKGVCLAPASQASDVVTNGNYDHDFFVSNYGTGSGTGINALLPTGVQFPSGNIDYGRSSRALSSAEKTDLQGWGYARDGIAIMSFGGRTGINLTPQQLHDIWTCSITDWSAIDGSATIGTSNPITPWSMNTSSGTYATFRDYIRAQVPADPTFDPNSGACVAKLQIASVATPPLENDTKPMFDPAKNGGVPTANGIWWSSSGEMNTFSYKRGASTSFISVNNISASSANVFNNTYPILRTLLHVTRKTDAILDGTNVSGSTLSGGVYTPSTAATGGKAGAVREFTKWLCRTTNAQHAVDPFTGLGYRTEIVNALNSVGFQQVPSALRTAGFSCAVQ